MGTIGAIWLLRSDGTFWDVDDDSGRPIGPLAPEWHHAAIRCGAERHPWLVELIPSRPQTAIDCSFCQGKGDVGFLCPECFARGWKPAA
jgi:hypothetical protein